MVEVDPSFSPSKVMPVMVVLVVHPNMRHGFMHLAPVFENVRIYSVTFRDGKVLSQLSKYLCATKANSKTLMFLAKAVPQERQTACMISSVPGCEASLCEPCFSCSDF